jgi:hypothetical protein
MLSGESATGKPAAMQGLASSYGVHPVDLEQERDSWRDYSKRLLLELGLPCKRVLLVAGHHLRIRKQTSDWNLWFSRGANLYSALSFLQHGLLGLDRQEDDKPNDDRQQPAAGRDRS